jgi:CheY-like chemotaxis protein
VSTILIVDDEPSVLDFMSVALESSGHILLKASTVEEAYERFDDADASIDLLIADVNLRGTSGIRVAVEFRSLLPNLAVVLTSGYMPDLWDQDELAELNELAFNSLEVLQKPFVPATLLQTVSRFVSVSLKPEIALAKASAN